MPRWSRSRATRQTPPEGLAPGNPRLKDLRRLLRDHPDKIRLFGYHDPDEFPGPVSG